MSLSSEQEGPKRAVAARAIGEVEDGIVVGLNSESTAAFVVEALAVRIAKGLRVVGIPTSEKTAALAQRLGVPLTSFAKHRRIDVAIDGANSGTRRGRLCDLSDREWETARGCDRLKEIDHGAIFSCDFSGPASSLPHFWEHTIGSGHAPLVLRADWQAQMQRSHEELGFGHVRFRGLLCDDMSTLIGEGDNLFYSFFNADQILDFLFAIGMKPFVELSFMPGTLASGDKTVFHYRANVTPPKDYAQWATLIRQLVAHWIERYGLAKVHQWFFEVWNEPNLDAFGSGRQDEYFMLYRYTAEAIKSVDSALKVGGPATAENAWIDDFIGFCTKGQLPADFISTHHYPTDAFGQPGDDTEAQLSKSRRSVLHDEMREVRRKAGDRPVYYTVAPVVAELNAVSRCEPEPHPFDFRDGAVGFDVTLPPLAVVAVTFRFAERDRG
ncbi:MAG: ribose-5-phosphate isomerase A [Steroidobacteraceae bacterium]